MAEIVYGGSSIGSVTVTSPTLSYGTIAGPTAKDLRQQAKAADKRERKAKAERKAAKARAKAIGEAQAAVRETLLAIVDSARHSAADRVAAAHELSTLGFI